MRITREVSDERPSDERSDKLAQTPKRGEESEEPLVALGNMLKEDRSVDRETKWKRVGWVLKIKIIIGSH